MKPYQLIELMPDEIFKNVFEDSPRKLRMAILGVSGAKKKKKRKSLRTRLASKEEEQKKLVSAAKKKLSEEDLDRFSEEVIRNHLAKTPEMLSDFLDFMEVRHQNGYTEDMNFTKSAPFPRVKEAAEMLLSKYPPEKVVLYLCYIELNKIIQVVPVREVLLSWGWDPDRYPEEEEQEQQEQKEDEKGNEAITSDKSEQAHAIEENDLPSKANDLGQNQDS
ncbi:MAG: hypothetical protein GXP49_14720 [Deltaproteobacteria bacterium]|nr:hypothetical protein [Deltaproteobacteria bacterium]